ncbi:MAG: cohesin domain-containing protein [Thermoanaerobaculia bacterium]
MRYLLIFIILSSLLLAQEVEFLKPKIEKDIFEIPVKIKAQEPFLALQFTLNYESTLKYEGFRWGELAQGALNALNDKVEGQIKGAMASGNPLPKEGIVFYIKFSGKGEIKFTEFLIQDKRAKVLQEKFEIKKK